MLAGFKARPRENMIVYIPTFPFPIPLMCYRAGFHSNLLATSIYPQLLHLVILPEYRQWLKPKNPVSNPVPALKDATRVSWHYRNVLDEAVI